MGREMKEFGLHGEITADKRLIFTVAERKKREAEAKASLKQARATREARTK
jgi:hypothetical protein